VRKQISFVFFIVYSTILAQNQINTNQNNVQLYNSDAATASEIPSGVLFGKFSKDDGPFLINGNIIVPAGQQLEFGPGCIIYLGGKYTTITVFGQIIMKGTQKEPVIIQSALKNPNPWDWDRIYCRSRNRSEFEHCIIRHSNYGIYVENSSIEIKKCKFERNSLHGLVVKNSNATISKSIFERGHVLAIFCQAGANVNTDSLIVRNNITGIACDERSYLSMTKGRIQGNTNGLAVKNGASVSIIATEVTNNRIGLASEIEISKNMREMIYKNGEDLKIVTPDEMEKILKPPEDVKSIALPTAPKNITTSNNFQPGFSALKAPREATASFIGNISAGFSFFYPESKNSQNIQTKYLGEHSDEWYSKFQPEIIVFAQGKRGLLDINLNSDFHLNTWIDNPTHIYTNLLTLSMNYGNQHVTFGDFYENASEISISGRKMRGIKYSGSFWKMDRGMNRMEFKLSAGQTEKKKDIGDHEPEIFSDTVDTGSSARQQITYVADLSFKPTHNSRIGIRGLIYNDQEIPLFDEQVVDTTVTDPISAQTGCIDGNVVLFDGKMEISAEIAMGTHDTVDTGSRADIAWYKPQVLKALPRVFSVINLDSNNYAFSLNVEGILQEFELYSSYLEIGENYFSAGNPYLEPDRRIISFGADRQFSDFLSTSFSYDYERTSVSNDTTLGDTESPTNINIFSLGGDYSFGENRPSVNIDYSLRIQSKYDQESYTDPVDTSLTETKFYKYKRMDHSIGTEVKQNFSNGINYSIKYKYVFKNDFSTDDIIEVEDLDDADENSVTGRFGFKVKKMIRNKTTVKIKYQTEKDDNKRKFDYKISDDLHINIIPRKLSLIIKGEYRNQNEKSDSDLSEGITVEQKMVQAELKYSFTSRVSGILMGKYEKYDDENEGSTENYIVKIGGLHLTYLF
jgi:hypothetical protein